MFVHADVGGAERLELSGEPLEQHELHVGTGPGDLAATDPRLNVARKLWSELARIAAQLERLDGNDLPPGLAEELHRIGYTSGSEDPAPEDDGER